jgi:hypothetical protein
MLILDQLQELNNTWKKILDVKRYDVSVSPPFRVGSILTSFSLAWTRWRMPRRMRARTRRRRVGMEAMARGRRAVRRESYDWSRRDFAGVVGRVVVPMAHE